MARYRFFYLVFVVVSNVMMFAYKSKLTSVLFLIAFLIPVISFVLLRISKALLKVRISYRTLSTEKYENTDITVTITNRFIIPLSPSALVGFFPYKNKERFEYQKIMVSVAPFSSVTVSFNSPIKYRGVYKAGVEKFVIYDLFKLFTATKKIGKYEEYVVVPRKLVFDPITDAGDGDSETLSQNSFSLDKNAFASIREYRTGDLIKNIHWTMSAKHDTLMVKQMERSVGGSSVIIPDLNEYFPFEEDNLEATDSIIEVLIALNLMLVSLQQSCVNVWYSPQDKQCEQFTVKNDADELLLFNMMSMLPRQTETFLPENIVESCTENSADTSTVYFITSQLRKDFIGRMTGISLFRNKKVRILLVSGPIESDEQKELAAAVSVTAGFELWKIDKDDLVRSVNSAAELYKKN
ncbi:MAG: DUF58 domain-containing protein [Ruminiclostridium sp.]